MSHSLSSYSWVMGAIIHLMSGCQDVLKMTSKNSCTYSLSVVTNFTILYVAHAVWESSSKLPVLSTSQMSKCHDPHQIYPVVSFKVKVVKLSFKLWSLAAFSSLTPPPSPLTWYESQAVNSSCESDMTHILEMSIWYKPYEMVNILVVCRIVTAKN